MFGWQTKGRCTSRWWEVNPTRRCMKNIDGHKKHVWFDPGTGRGDDKRFEWED